MKPEAKSVTIAFVLVAFGLAVRNHWLSGLATWVGKPPQKPGSSSSALPLNGQLTQVQAAALSYAILILLTETQAAPVAPPIAWALGLVSLFSATGVLSTEYPTLFGKPAPAGGGNSSTNVSLGAATQNRPQVAQ